MKAALLVRKSLAQYSGTNQKQVMVSDYSIADVLNALDPSFLSQFSNLEVATDGTIRTYNPVGFSANYNKNVAVSEVEASEEVYFLTQVILNTLNTEPSQFHDMFDIPGLEGERWDTLANIAQYLISQGWLEAKAVEEKLLVKLTIEGKIYLRNNNAWS